MDSGLILRFRNNNRKGNCNLHFQILGSSVTSTTARRFTIKVKRRNFSLCHSNGEVRRTTCNFGASFHLMRTTIIRLRTRFQRPNCRTIGQTVTDRVSP